MSERDQDFEDARRGFIAALDPGRIEAPDGRVVWDSDAYDFLAGDCPETATPSLWRQSRLTATMGMVRRQPRPPVGAPACGARAPLRGGDRRHRCDAGPRP